MTQLAVRQPVVPRLADPSAPDLDAVDLSGLVSGLAARAAEHDRLATFPHEAFEALWQAGVLNLTVPVALGGLGAGLARSCRVVQAVAGGDPSVALVLSQHLLHHALLADPSNPWPADVRERVQRSSIEGVALVNFIRVEPDLGTPARGGLPATVAERLPGGGWAIHGHKTYSTGIPALRWLSVYARTDDGPERPAGASGPEPGPERPAGASGSEHGAGGAGRRSRSGGESGEAGAEGAGRRSRSAGKSGGHDPEPLVGTFLVPADTPGITVVETWDHLGMRATASHDTLFDGVVIPADHAVDIRPASTLGPPDPVVTAWNGLLIAALYHGVAVAARDWLVGYLHERVPANLGAPLASLPRFQSAVGSIEALLHTSERLIHGAAADVDRAKIDAGDTAAATAVPLVKHTATTNAIRAVEIGIELIGNPGLSRRNPIERHYRDVLCSRIHTPQDDSILLGAGRAALASAAAPRP